MLDPATTCAPCLTAAGCDKHRRFMCATCGDLVHWSDGGADDRPDDCSGCWARWFDAMRAIATGLLGWIGS